MSVFSLSPEQVEPLWGYLAPLLEQFERQTGAWASQQVKQLAMDGKQQIWGTYTGRFEKVTSIAVTEVLNTPRGLICQIVVYVGDMSEMDELLKDGTHWAKSLGCVALRVSGRKGWLRKGFKQTGIVAEREI